MKRTNSFSNRQAQGFTLIEMLVVIAIIGILAGMIVPAVAKAKTNAKKKVAKMEMESLMAAIHQYESEYSRLPATKQAYSETLAAADKDFTYGADWTQPAIYSYWNSGGTGYKAANAQLMAMLLAPKQINASYTDLTKIAGDCNPHQNQFFSPKQAAGDNSPGLGPDYVLRDPWGNPYIITIDLDGNNICYDGLYSHIMKNGPNSLPGSVLVWSFGPDGKASLDCGPGDGENKDNVVSWK